MVHVPRRQVEAPQTLPAAPPAKRPPGRLLGYTDEIGAAICAGLASGKSLVAVCAEPGMPSRDAVYHWLEKVEKFADNYARAREMQADFHADELIALADQARDETTEGIAAIRLQLDTRKWVAAKLRPRVYGERSSVEHSGAVAIEHLVAGSMPAAQLEAPIDAEYVDVTEETT